MCPRFFVQPVHLCVIQYHKIRFFRSVGILTSSHFVYWTTLILACQALNAGSNIVSAISCGVIHPRVIHVLACLLLQSFLTGTFLMCLPPLTGSPNRAIMTLMNFLISVLSVFSYLVSCLTCISAITTSMSFALTIAFVTATFFLYLSGIK